MDVQVTRKKKTFTINKEGQAVETKAVPVRKPTTQNKKTRQAEKKPAPAPIQPAETKLPELTPQEQKKAQEAKIRKRIEPLCSQWPQLFSYEKPKPVMIGIHKVIKAQGHWNQAVKNALGFYVNRYTYRRAMARGGCRYDLEGNEAGSISEKDQASAVQYLEQRKAARKKQSGDDKPSTDSK